jgi:16S rRNA C1402 N4-methylase RsmH
MRYNKTLLKITAKDILNKFSEKELFDFLFQYGGIKKAH